MFKKETENVDILDIKKKIKTTIEESYGSIDNFIEVSKVGKEVGKNLKTYLYPSGSISYPILKKLCKHLNIGVLTKKTEIIKKITYHLQ